MSYHARQGTKNYYILISFYFRIGRSFVDGLYGAAVFLFMTNLEGSEPESPSVCLLKVLERFAKASDSITTTTIYCRDNITMERY